MFKKTNYLNHVWANAIIKITKKTIKSKNRRMVEGNRLKNQEKKNKSNGARWRGYLHNQQR